MAVLRNLAMALGAASVALSPSISGAETYPSRPMTLIIHSSAGGTADLVNRLVAEKVSSILGQPIILDFRPGGGQTIGASAVARAEPDGYTIGFLGSGLIAAQGLGKSLSFDVREFVPIGRFLNLRLGYAVNPDLGTKNVAQFIAKAKAEPGKLNYASTGYGGTTHIAMELFMQATGTKLTHIPYQKDTLALQDIVAGRVDIYTPGTSTAIPLANDKRITLIAVTGEKRAAAAPDIPTLREQGFGNAEFFSWGSWVMPPKTPPEIVKKLTEAFLKATKDDAIRKRFEEVGSELVSSGPEDCEALIKSELVRYQELRKSANIKLD